MEVAEGPSSPTPLSGESDELMLELRSFLSVSNQNSATVGNSSSRSGGYGHHISKGLRRSALYLLRNLPAAREAVLEFYSSIFDASVDKHFTQGEVDEVIPEIRRVLSEFLEANADSWAPLISHWSLGLLGDLSSKYQTNVPKNCDINEILRVWLDCPGTRTLIDLTAQCLTSLISTDTESTVSALLDTSVKHSPHFDWVVAHIAGCFPETIITRVLSVGLKNFYQYTTSQIDVEGGVNFSKVPKINSVVGILDHLAGTHDSVIQEALKSMISDCLQNVKFNKNNSLEIATIPYLLSLCSRSPNLTFALTENIFETGSRTEVVERLTKLVGKWSRTFFKDTNNLVDLVVHLILGSKSDDALRLLLEIGGNGKTGSNGAKLIMESLHNELLPLVHHTPPFDQSAKTPAEIPVLVAVSENLQLFLDKYILSSDSFQQNSALFLIHLTALYIGRSISVRTIKHCLTRGTDIAILHRYIRDSEPWQPVIVPLALSQSLKASDTKPLPLLDNLIRIIEYEKQDVRDIRIQTEFAPIVSEHQDVLLNKLSFRPLIPRIIRLFQLVPLERSNMTVSLMHRAIVSFVHTIFTLFADMEMDHKEKVAQVLDCEEVLNKLSSDPIGLPMVLRFLMEGVLCSRYSVYFGGKYESPFEKKMKSKASARKKNVKLMDENMKFGTMPTHSVGATSIYHAGVIGNGPKLDPEPEVVVPPDTAAKNRFLFVNVLFKICQMESKEKAREATKQLALLLVDLVSPDVMYNGLPWPEEEFTKVTIERDLRIRQSFRDHPILWPIMMGLAEARPAMCYSSVLLRALMAVHMSHWHSSIAKVATDNSVELEGTKKVLELMSVGQFLPHPLNSVGDVLHVLKPYHVHCILMDVWNFMRDNVPSPVSYKSTETETGEFITNREFEPFSKYKLYCERLRLIMIKHITQVPLEFKRFFVDVARSNSEHQQQQQPPQEQQQQQPKQEEGIVTVKQEQENHMQIAMEY